MTVTETIPAAAATATATNAEAPVVGIIYPPPEVRNIIDKTASFVAKNGEKFEERIKDKEAGNPKFNFLQSTDPYYAYYRFKIKDFQEGKSQDSKKEEKKEEAPTKKIPKEPPPFEFITEMTPISAQDLDIMKLTAQFVARNGRQFLTGLSTRESRNYQFDFLRPGHSLFVYFTRLVEQYTKVLMPPKSIKETLQVNANDKQKLIERVMERAEYMAYQEAEKKRVEDEAEKEKEAYAAIDWHDFGVIGTIEFTGEEDLSELPAPITINTLMQRSLIEKKTMPLLPAQALAPTSTTTTAPPPRPQDEDVDMEMEEVEMEEEEGSKTKESEPAMPLPTIEGPIKIVKDYVPKAKADARQKEQMFLFQGVMVPASQLPHHMKVELLDPKWKTQREIEAQKNKETNLAPGEDISRNLQSLAARRTDIFGEVEVGIGKKVGEEEDKNLKILKEQKAWDGHISSIGSTTKAAQQGLDEHIQALHKSIGLSDEPKPIVVGPQVPDEVKPGQTTPLFPRPPIPTLQSAPRPPISIPSFPAAPITIPPPSHPHLAHLPQPPPPPGAPPGLPPVGAPQPHGAPPGFPPPPPGFPSGFPSAPPGFPSAPPGFPPAPPGFPPRPMTFPNMTLGGAMPPALHPFEPAAKKPKLDEYGLIPEADFIAMHKGPVSFRVQIPESSEKGTWKLNGQTLNITLDITDTIAKLKDKIQEEIEMPPNKMNLKLTTAKDPDALGFLRETCTLGFYNVNNASIIDLMKKERGKKK